jgi:DNA-binding transcriptional ArsR family regulator
MTIGTTAGQRVLDLRGRRAAYRLRLEFGTAYELLVTLCAFCHPPRDVATFDGGPSRRRLARTLASPQLLDAIERIGPNAGKAWMNFIGVAATRPPTRLVPGFLERVDGMDPVELRFTLLGGHVPAYQRGRGRDAIRQAAEGDREAARSLLADRSYFSGDARALASLLRLSPTETAGLAREILHRWYEDVFRPSERAAAEALAAEAVDRRPVLRSEPPDRAIERITSIEFVHDPAIDEVVLVPQLAMRPWLLLCEYDATRLFCYPAGGPREGRDDDRARVLALARALGDPKRMQMLEALASGAARVPELSSRFSLPTSTTYHHLAILRASGLVTVTSDAERRYSVRSEALQELRASLEALLSGRARSDRNQPSREGGHR